MPELCLVLERNPVAVKNWTMQMIFALRGMDKKCPVQQNWQVIFSYYRKLIRFLEFNTAKTKSV